MFNGAAALGADGRIYVFGGLETNCGPSSAHVYAYEVATAHWSTIADLPSAPMGTPVGVAVGRTIYSIADQTYAYDIDARVWSTKAAFASVSNYNVAATGSDGKIYLRPRRLSPASSGCSARRFTSAALDEVTTVEAFDPVAMVVSTSSVATTKTCGSADKCKRMTPRLTPGRRAARELVSAS
jgi:Galactose oxidase, central domain